VSENRLLKRKYKTGRDEVTGGWKVMHNEESIGCTRPILIIFFLFFFHKSTAQL
jgi:hypothetical protein